MKILRKPKGGQAPFGYQWMHGSLIVDPEEATVRKLMYQLFLEHRRKKTVARILNERGYRTRRGGDFTDTTIKRLLEDPTAKGLQRINFTRRNGKNQTWKLKPKSEWIISEVEALVSEDVWETVTRILKGGRGTGKIPRHLFAGLVWCGCGRKMQVASDTPKYICTACRNSIVAMELVRVFQEALKECQDDAGLQKIFQIQEQSEVVESEEILADLERRLEKLGNELNQVDHLETTRHLNRKITAGISHRLSKEHQQISDSIQSEKRNLRLRKIKRSVGNRSDDRRSLDQRWADLPHSVRRRAVDHVIESLVIDGDDVAINLK